MWDAPPNSPWLLQSLIFIVGPALLGMYVVARETEVLACPGQGLSNAQIATRLYLTEPTVKGYISRLLVKLQCANRTQIGLMAYEAGIGR